MTPPSLQLDVLSDSLQGAVWLDEQGQVGWHNPAAQALLGRDLLGVSLSKLLSPYDASRRPVPREHSALAAAGAAQGLFALIHVDQRWFQVSCHPLGEGRLCLLADITDLEQQAMAYRTTLEVLSGLVRQEENIADLLQRVLETAVAVVPGCDAGSISLREDEVFRFVAQVGFGQALLGHTFPSDLELLWYGEGETAWHLGRPRLIRGSEIQQRSAAQAGELAELLKKHGRVREIQASICVPVVLQGEVLATINLDNLRNPDGFPPEALPIAQAFGIQTAGLLYGQLARKSLTSQALTDPLTGLGNRRALEDAFPKLQAQAKRLGLPLTMLYWDMDRLKRLNDTQGHAAGDQALKRMADSLQAFSRQGDAAFRVGGDEFVSLHLNLPVSEAQELIERVRGNLQVRVSAGSAAIDPEMSLEEALFQTDAAMYRDKPAQR
ncbi:sensor domain-containing diguanylate cyclase [Allomeiothermus silvanus]|uniref:sensor domain-containing diguanylate cyclase n=1 Tax=Allomeiothermus silvanus TaxID=52022 RepID=UPI0023F2FC0A|nr:sensor domain-containing diguanylate cyclase [Allomeiothermus silvanus]